MHWPTWRLKKMQHDKMPPGVLSHQICACCQSAVVSCCCAGKVSFSRWILKIFFFFNTFSFVLWHQFNKKLYLYHFFRQFESLGRFVLRAYVLTQKKFHTKTSQQWINPQPARWLEQHRVWLWVWRSLVVSSLPILCPTRLVSFSSIHLWFVLHESASTVTMAAQCALTVFLIFFFSYLCLLSPLILVSRKDVSSMNWLRPRSRAARRRGRGRRKRKIWTNWRRKWIWWEFGLVCHPILSIFSTTTSPLLLFPTLFPFISPFLAPSSSSPPSFVAIHPFLSTVNLPLHLFILWEVSFQNKRSTDNAPANVIGHTHIH